MSLLFVEGFDNNLVTGNKITLYDVVNWRTRALAMFEGTVTRVNGKTSVQVTLDQPFDGADFKKVFKVWSPEWEAARMYTSIQNRTKLENQKTLMYKEVKETFLEVPRGETVRMDENLALSLLPETQISEDAKNIVGRENPFSLFTAGDADVAAGRNTYQLYTPAAFRREGATFSQAEGLTCERPQGKPMEGFFFMRPFLPEVVSPPTDTMWGAVLIPATPCKVTVTHTEGPTSQRSSKMEFETVVDHGEMGTVTVHRGRHYFMRTVTVTMEVPHGLNVGDKVKFMDWNPGDDTLRNLTREEIAGAAPAFTFQDSENRDGTFDLCRAKTTAWSHMISDPYNGGNDANKYEKKEDWFAQMFQNKWPTSVSYVHQNNTRDVDNKGFNYQFEGPWKFNFDVDHYLGMKWLNGTMEVASVDDPYTFSVVMKTVGVFPVDNKWRKKLKTGEVYKREVQFVDDEEDIPGNVQPFVQHEFNIFCDLTNGECVKKYSAGDLIYVSGSRDDKGVLQQHRSGVKQVGYVTDDANAWTGDGDWTGIQNVEPWKNGKHIHISGNVPLAKRIGILDGRWILPGDNEYDRPGSEVYNRSRYDIVELFRDFNFVQKHGAPRTVSGRFAGVVAWQAMFEHDMKPHEKDINIDHTNAGAQITPLTHQEVVVSEDPSTYTYLKTQFRKADEMRLDNMDYEVETEDVFAPSEENTAMEELRTEINNKMKKRIIKRAKKEDEPDAHSARAHAHVWRETWKSPLQGPVQFKIEVHENQHHKQDEAQEQHVDPDHKGGGPVHAGEEECEN